LEFAHQWAGKQINIVLSHGLVLWEKMDEKTTDSFSNWVARGFMGNPFRHGTQLDKGYLYLFIQLDRSIQFFKVMAREFAWVHWALGDSLAKKALIRFPFFHGINACSWNIRLIQSTWTESWFYRSTGSSCDSSMSWRGTVYRSKWVQPWYDILIGILAGRFHGALMHIVQVIFGYLYLWVF
jgi:hypothetical protein